MIVFLFCFILYYFASSQWLVCFLLATRGWCCFTWKSLLGKYIFCTDGSCQNKLTECSSKTCSHRAAWGVYSNKERQSWLMVVGTECMWGKWPFFYKLPTSKGPAISGHIMPPWTVPGWGKSCTVFWNSQWNSERNRAVCFLFLMNKLKQAPCLIRHVFLRLM